MTKEAEKLKALLEEIEVQKKVHNSMAKEDNDETKRLSYSEMHEKVFQVLEGILKEVE